MRFSPNKNFVLLDELIDSVAQKVPIPETLIDMYQDADEGRMPITWNLSSANDPYLGQVDSSKSAQSNKAGQNDANANDVVEASEVEQAILRMKRYRISHFFQRSSAAASVIVPITNAPASEDLQWFDTMLVPGSVLRAPGCRDEGLKLLAMVARSGREYREAFEMTTPRSARYSPTPLENRLPPAPVNPARLRQIGFDRTELITFLNDCGISHALGGMSSDLTVAAQETSATAFSLEGRDGTGKKFSSNELAVTSASTVPVALKPRRPKFRGPLSEVLNMAWENARDRSDYKSAFAAFIDIARQENPPLPLVEYISEERAVKWNDYEDEAEPTKFFTLESMRSRYRSLGK